MLSPGRKVRLNRSGRGGGMSRRTFLGGTAGAAALGVVARHALGAADPIPPSERTTLAFIGTGGQGIQNLMSLLQFAEVQVVAVCDVVKESSDYQSWNWSSGRDRKPAGREPARRLADEYYTKTSASGSYQGCRAYADYRELLDKEDVDGVVVSTPDHTHAVITMAALKRGKHVYCEKPLTYSVYEARQVTEAARKAGVATQLGNHGQAAEEARVTCEMIWEGAIGPVREVEVWHGARFWHYPSFEGRPTDCGYPRF